MKSWVSVETWDQISRSFGCFDAEDSWREMQETCDLFGRIARETAGVLECKYPDTVEDNIMSFARELSAGVR